MGWTTYKKPSQPKPPPQYDRSCGMLGIIAERDCAIELRAPDPEAGNNGGSWRRVWLTPDAAETLLEWLPEALAYARGATASAEERQS